jgi:hypothetical protein
VEQPRGPWPYSAEIDLGFSGALRCAATIVADDPVFGLIAYGGQLTRSGATVQVVPLDGVGRRFHVMRGSQRWHMELARDGFAEGQPVRFDDAAGEITFTLENRAGKDHQTALRVSGLPAGKYAVLADGKAVATFTGGATESIVTLPVAGSGARVVLKRG